MISLGIDIGTTSLSAIAIDASNGTVLAASSIPNQSAVKSTLPWEKRQDPEVIFAAVSSMLDELIARYRPVISIGLTGQMHGVLYLDKRGMAVSDLFTWQDGRGGLLWGQGTYAEHLSELASQPISTGFGVCTHAWFTYNHALPPGAAALCTIADYIAMRLTGRTEPLLHASNAAGIGMFDMQMGRFDKDLIRRAGMDASFFPKTTPDFRVLGEYGQGIPVCAAIGDNQASFLGSVSAMAESILINIGTGAQISMLSGPNQSSGGSVERRPLNSSCSLLVGSALCGGKAYALLEDFLRSCLRLAGIQRDSLYAEMNLAAANRIPDEDPLLISTQFAGTRQDPTARGAVYNIGMDNFDAIHLIQSTLAGIAQELYGLFLQMKSGAGAEPKQIIGSGNAIRKNQALARAVQDMFKLPVLLPIHQEEASFGAALAALVACGRLPDIASAKDWIKYKYIRGPAD